MNITKPGLIFGLLLAAGVGVIAIAVKRELALETAPPIRQVAAAPAPVVPPPPPETSPEEPAPAATETAAGPAPVETKKSPAPAAAPPGNGQRQLQDPTAREALKLVGVDPEAEAYWLEAINDPDLSDSEREDLIEDLNENGFSANNGRTATVDDVPLIARRLQIIEDLAPYAMDENNWRSFLEARKDLEEMLARLSP